MKGKIEILLVEDTPSDVRLTQEALKESQLDYEMSIVGDGVEALEYLNKLKDLPDCRLPQVILLDLNMPRKNGHELLEDIKTDPLLSTIPVILLTVSERDEDVLEALHSKMNFYLAKPVTAEKLCSLMKTFHELRTDQYFVNGVHSQEESHIRFVLAGNPHTALFALAKLADDPSERIRARVAENSRLTEELQLKLARDPQALVRVSLCENTKLTKAAIDLLATDENQDVRLSLTTGPAITVQVLERLANDENVYVSASARKSLSCLEQGIPVSVTGL